MVQETAKEVEKKPGAIPAKGLDRFKDAEPAKKPALAGDRLAQIEDLFVDLMKNKRTGKLVEEMAKLEKEGIAIAPIMQNVAKKMGWVR
ncbi:MAG: hypothetical protein NTY68_02295 [Candidatus Micrarchaeota archaeon]|nr:hypothetical protein [Candidatus Micrarchaeota archaeon]